MTGARRCSVRPRAAQRRGRLLGVVWPRRPGGFVDRRITKSKRALRDALIALMEERGFDALSVGDLCARADLNRGTFYNHFRDKDALLAALEDEVVADLDRLQERMQDLTVRKLLGYRARKRPLPLLVDLFDYLREQGDFLHAVLGPGGDVRFGPRLRDAVCTNLIQSILHERYRNNPEPFVQYYVAFFASAYLGVIQRWIETGMRESSEEMALIAMRLFFIKPGESITL
ncbi:TetR family transcriptional regulator [Gordonibacter sp. An230]|nr:TetR family transcriptional regulator [Gordonibacter sp. An230]